MGFEETGFAPSHKFLAAFIDVVPASAAIDAEKVTDRGCHVAAAMDSEIFRKPLLCDQWTEETLIVFLDGPFTLIARHTEWGGRLVCVINDRGIPSFAKKDRHDQQR
jgi:hypothetical protein